MTRLLVSVRNAQEAEEALAGGADLIDAKEPNLGSLGRCDVAITAEIIATVAGRVPVSAALGELGDAHMPPLTGLRYAKLGLAGWRNRDWVRAWQGQCVSWPADCGPVAVAYADSSEEKVVAPDVDEVIDAAIRTHVAALLIDTHLKNGSTLFDWMTVSKLREIIQQCHAENLAVAVAGSLGFSQVHQLLPLGPGWIAVRGAACIGGRDGMISRDKVRELADAIHSG